MRFKKIKNILGRCVLVYAAISFSTTSRAQNSIAGGYPTNGEIAHELDCNNQTQEFRKIQDDITNACSQVNPADPNVTKSITECKKQFNTCNEGVETAVDAMGNTVKENQQQAAKNASDPDYEPPDADEEKDKKECPDPGDVKDDTSTKTACSALPARDQVTQLNDILHEKRDTARKDAKQVYSAEKDQAESMKTCQYQIGEIGNKISTAQIDLKSASAEEMTELGGINVQLTEKLSDLQTQIQLATTDLASINGPELTQAMSEYQMAIATAQTSCHKKLQDQASANKLSYSTLQDAINASQVGLTTYKCDRDFDTQMARSVALQALNQKRQALQVKFLQVQTKIASLNRDVLNAKRRMNLQQQALITKYTNRIAQDQTAITNYTQQQQALQNNCMRIAQTDGNEANDAKKEAQRAADGVSRVYCQMDYLEHKFGVSPASKPDADTKRLEDLRTKIDNLSSRSNPCDPGEPCVGSKACSGGQGNGGKAKATSTDKRAP